MYLNMQLWTKYFFPPQVKRSMIISDKHGIYKLPYELLSDLTLRILEN